MDNKKELIKSIYENSVKGFEISKKSSEIQRHYNSFIEDEALDGVFAGDDEDFANAIASQVIMSLSEKSDLNDFFEKVKEFRQAVNEADKDLSEVKQNGFVLSKQAEEFSVATMDIDVLAIEMTRHSKWHKVKKDIEELCEENNLPVTFAVGKAYMATYPLNEKSPKECLSSLIKNSETKGNFLRSILPIDNAVSKVTEDRKKDFIISNNTMLDIKMLQMNPTTFEEDVMKAISDKPRNENENSIKNK